MCLATDIKTYNNQWRPSIPLVINFIRNIRRQAKPKIKRDSAISFIVKYMYFPMG